MMTKIEIEKLYHSYVEVLNQRLDSFTKDLKQSLAPFYNITYKARIKSFESFYPKALSRTKEGQCPLLAVKDLLAVRLICPFNEDVDVITEYLEQNYHIVEIERKDLTLNFKEFGYNSTHLEVQLPADYAIEGLTTSLSCEIQVRTILQDAWAEVEHELVYKNKFATDDKQLRHKMAAINANLTLSDIIFQEIRNNQKQLRSGLDRRSNRLQQQIDQLLSPDYSVETASLVDPFPLVDDLDSLMLEAVAAHNTWQYDKAVDIYTKILNDDRDINHKAKSMVLASRGMALFSCKLYPAALADFKEADALLPDARTAYYLGILLLLQKEYAQSVPFFDKSLSLDSDQPQAYLGRARAYYKLGKHKKALSNCNLCLSMSPDLITAINLKELIQSQAHKQLKEE